MFFLEDEALDLRMAFANSQAANSAVSQISGDILQMRNGTLLQGSFVSGDNKTIKYTALTTFGN